MLDFFSYLFALLIPIVLILIVRLKRRRRVEYSHTYLRSFEDERLLDYLLRTFRIYYDVLFDLLIALVLALFLAQVVSFAPRHTAVCIDGSYSMIRAEEQNDLEKAVSRALEQKNDRGRARLFLLAWDRRRGKTRVFRLREPGIPPGTDPAARTQIIRSYAEKLKNSHSFFNIDISTLQRLFDRGFRKVVFVTDRLPAGAANLEVVQAGGSESPFFYPTSIHYDFSSASFQILIYRFEYERQIAVLRYDEQLENYKLIPAAEQSIPGNDLSLIEIQEEGLYRIVGPGMDYIYNLSVPTHTVEPSGIYSKLLADVLPQLESGPSPILLADLAYSGEGRRELARGIRALGRYRHRYITLIPENYTPAGPLLYPLERTLSQPAYAELPDQITGAAWPSMRAIRLFFQDPRRTSDGQTPLVYLSYLESDDPIEFSHEGDFDTRGWDVSENHSGITATAYTRGEQLRPINLAAREFFNLPAPTDLVFEQRRVKHLPYFLILLLLFSAKLLFLLRFQRGG